MKVPNYSFPIDAAARARILVIGDIMLDRYWFGDVHRISPEAPVPVVHVSRCEDRLGGAANVARNAAALGARVTVAGVVGDDEPGWVIEGLLQQFGIRACLTKTPAPTIVKMRVLGRQQQLLRVDFEERPAVAAAHALVEQVLPLMEGHDIVVLSDYAKGALEQAQALITAARRVGKPVLVDPKGDDYTKYRGATLISPNRAEMQEAVGRWRDEDDLTSRAQSLRQQLDLDGLLVTRSEQGMTLYTATGRAHTEAHAQEVFDVSGAGDTVLATLAVMRGAGLEWESAMYWANRAAGIVVGKVGTSFVTPEELGA